MRKGPLANPPYWAIPPNNYLALTHPLPHYTGMKPNREYRHAPVPFDFREALEGVIERAPALSWRNKPLRIADIGSALLEKHGARPPSKLLAPWVREVLCVKTRLVHGSTVIDGYRLKSSV